MPNGKKAVEIAAEKTGIIPDLFSSDQILVGFKRKITDGGRHQTGVMVFNVTIDDRHLSGEGPDQGCFAGTIGSNDRPVLTGSDFPAGSREKAKVPDPNRNPVQCDERLSVSADFWHFFPVFLNGRSE
jgi:hypothetical protein